MSVIAYTYTYVYIRIPTYMQTYIRMCAYTPNAYARMHYICTIYMRMRIIIVCAHGSPLAHPALHIALLFCWAVLHNMRFIIYIASNIIATTIYRTAHMYHMVLPVLPCPTWYCHATHTRS